MPSGSGGRYRLTPRAFDDLDEIWRFSAETWSAAQAERYVDTLADLFETIATMPTLTRERTEFTPPVRIHTHEAHVIVYTIAVDHVVILRLLGGRQDWASILKATDP